jgi:hypothetical protein
MAHGSVLPSAHSADAPLNAVVVIRGQPAAAVVPETLIAKVRRVLSQTQRSLA